MANDTHPTNGGTLTRMNSNSPAQKVTATVIAGAIVQLLLWLNELGDGPSIPTHVEGALTVLIAFAAGYLIPPGSQEQVIEVKRAQAPIPEIETAADTSVP